MQNSKKTVVEKILEAEGYSLPQHIKPAAIYVPAKKHQGLIYTSGQLPISEKYNEKLVCTGALTSTSSQSQRDLAAQGLIYCLINAFAAAQKIESLDKITGIIRLGIFVQSSPNFHDHHLIANPVSQLASKCFPNSLPTRTTVGVVDLPLNSTVEMEVLFSLNLDKQ